MRLAIVWLLVLLAVPSATAIKIDISLQDIERALVIARSRESDRARFHAAYIQELKTPFVERAEFISEFRRVVLLAEERANKGDR